MTYIIEYDGKFITSNRMPRLCQNLTNKGLNIPNQHFIVKDFNTSEELCVIYYNADDDVWMKHVPEHYRPIKDTKGLKNNIPKVEL